MWRWRVAESPFELLPTLDNDLHSHHALPIVLMRSFDSEKLVVFSEEVP